MRLLVAGYRLVSYEYFLDRLQPYELPALIEALPYADRAAWEQTRLKIFSTALMFSKNQLNLQDILTFPWEEKPEPQQPPTKAELQRLKATANKLITNGTGL